MFNWIKDKAKVILNEDDIVYHQGPPIIRNGDWWKATDGNYYRMTQVKTPWKTPEGLFWGEPLLPRERDVLFHWDDMFQRDEKGDIVMIYEDRKHIKLVEFIPERFILIAIRKTFSKINNPHTGPIPAKLREYFEDEDIKEHLRVRRI